MGIGEGVEDPPVKVAFELGGEPRRLSVTSTQALGSCCPRGGDSWPRYLPCFWTFHLPLALPPPQLPGSQLELTFRDRTSPKDLGNFPQRPEISPQNLTGLSVALASCVPWVRCPAPQKDKGQTLAAPVHPRQPSTPCSPLPARCASGVHSPPPHPTRRLPWLCSHFYSHRVFCSCAAPQGGGMVGG